MKHAERITPVAAVVSALLSIACCLPFAFPAALGLAGLGVVFSAVRPWLAAASLALLGVGLVQLLRRRACGRRSPASLALFGIAALVVLGFLLFPQWIAGLIADLG